MKQPTYYLVTAVAIVAVAAISFWGGMKVEQRRAVTIGFNGGFGAGTGARFVAARGQNNPNGAFGTGVRGGMGMMGNGPIAGEIINQDETSVTVKLSDGSTKIVLVTDQTAYTQASEAAKSSLKVGDQITAFGPQNQDGSVTAQNVVIGQLMMRWTR